MVQERYEQLSPVQAKTRRRWPNDFRVAGPPLRVGAHLLQISLGQDLELSWLAPPSHRDTSAARCELLQPAHKMPVTVRRDSDVELVSRQVFGTDDQRLVRLPRRLRPQILQMPSTVNGHGDSDNHEALRLWRWLPDSELAVQAGIVNAALKRGHH